MAALIISVWKGIYSLESKTSNKIGSLDKKTSLGFMKVKNDLETIRKDINSRFDDLENLIRKKKI